jgi:hypothetical protein
VDIKDSNHELWSFHLSIRDDHNQNGRRHWVPNTAEEKSMDFSKKSDSKWWMLDFKQGLEPKAFSINLLILIYCPEYLETPLSLIYFLDCVSTIEKGWTHTCSFLLLWEIGAALLATIEKLNHDGKSLTLEIVTCLLSVLSWAKVV